MAFGDLIESRSRLKQIVAAQKRGSQGRRRLVYVGEAAAFLEQNGPYKRVGDWELARLEALLTDLSNGETRERAENATDALIELLRLEELLLE